MTTTPPRGAGEGRATMRPRAYLDFVRDRVIAEIAANPSQRPYLGEDDKIGHRPRRETCSQGHTITGEGKQRRCVACLNQRRAEQRARS